MCTSKSITFINLNPNDENYRIVILRREMDPDLSLTIRLGSVIDESTIFSLINWVELSTFSAILRAVHS
jgi:hypothetical protein